MLAENEDRLSAESLYFETNMRDSTTTFLKTGPWAGYLAIGQPYPFDESWQAFVNSYVHESDRERLISNYTFDNIRKAMADEQNSWSFDFRAITPQTDEPHWFSLVIMLPADAYKVFGTVRSIKDKVLFDIATISRKISRWHTPGVDESSRILQYREPFPGADRYSMENGITRSNFGGNAEDIEKLHRQVVLSEASLRAIAEHSGVFYWLYDMKNNSCVNGYKSVHDLGMPEIMGDYPECIIRNGFITSLSAHTYREMHKKLCEGEPWVEEDIRTQDPDGTIKWMRTTYTNIFDSDGKPYMALGTSQNVDRYKAMVDSFTMAAQHSGLISWTYDARIKTIFIDSKSNPLFKGNMLRNVPQSLIDGKLIHEDDVQDARRLFERIAEGEPVSTGVIRIRKTLKDNWVWYRIYLTSVLEENGRPGRAIGSAVDITEQKEAEEHYQNELINRKFMAPDVLISYRVDLTADVIEESNNNSPYTEDLAKMQTYTQLFDAIVSVVHEDKFKSTACERFKREALIESCNNGENDKSIEYRRNLGDKTLHWISVNIKLLKNPNNGHVMGFMYTRDVSSAKFSELITQHMLDADFDLFACIDTTTGLCTVLKDMMLYDKSSNQRYDQEYKALTERCAKDFIVPDEREKYLSSMDIENVVNALENSEEYSFFITMRTADGTLADKKLTFSYMEKNHGLILFTGTDVTDVLAEEHRKNRELGDALALAEKASSARGEFLAHMSHEIRTPLNGIKGMLDLIKHGGSETEKTEYLDKALISTKHLTGLINDILDMSKIDSGKIELSPTYLSKKEVMDYINAIIRPLADGKRIALTIHMQPVKYRYIYVDEGRLKQILINLLSNSVKYTNEGGSIDFSVLSELSGKDALDVTFIVEDNGIGMSKEFIDHAFEPFTQAAAVNASKGTGLGLAITKKLVELMGGDLHIESTPGTGTKISFTITAPAKGCMTDNGSDVQKTSEHEEAETDDFSGRRALLAEDNEINRMIAVKQLEFAGMAAETAENGQEAVKMFARSEPGYYDIIFMDIMMPVKDGFEATKDIRAMNRSDAEDIPIVAMTANAFAEDVHKSLENGLNFHLSKPFDREQLLQILVQAFSAKSTF